ncbi:hypothetical protein [Paraburkholderia sp. ZP32-5]|uniref:hypothetical protein n=1 Tax=Paraburkholderia sp. ZP32-5 TaxID=2883245 RepID=UPI001F2F546B|nr:hypothetical protein [Paraburkholderia sp. ZP32-5]
MTEEQQARVLQAMQTGLRWAAGETTFEDVKWILGNPAGPIKRGIERVYRYELVEATLEFAFDGAQSDSSNQSPRYFQLRVDGGLITHISGEDCETYLGLRPLVYGELIDGVRKEQGHFLNPGLGDFLGDRNHVGLSYRLPLPADLLFDVYADFDFEGRNDPPDYASLKTADNLRSVTITRTYLTQKELDERRTAKHWR